MKLFKMSELEIPTQTDDSELDTPLDQLVNQFDDMGDDSELDTPLDQLASGGDNVSAEFDSFDDMGDDSELDTPLDQLGDNLDGMDDEFDMDDDELNEPLMSFTGANGSTASVSPADGSDVGDDEFGLFNNESGENETGDMENPDEPTEDSDYQGTIRTVKGAYLIYKRKQPDDTYEELWIYNVGKDLKQENQVRRAVLAGTDIDPSTNQSETGDQNVESTTLGNVQFLLIQNLEN